MHQVLHVQSDKKRGVSLIEVVIGSAIILLVSLAIITLYSRFINFSAEATTRIKATLLAREGIESMRYLRDTGWDETLGTYSTGVPYYIVATSTTITATTTSQPYIDARFNRYITIEDVRRIGTDDISGSGTIDATTKLITATVEWSDRGATTTKSFSAYLMKYKE